MKPAQVAYRAIKTYYVFMAGLIIGLAVGMALQNLIYYALLHGWHIAELAI